MFKKSTWAWTWLLTAVLAVTVMSTAVSAAETIGITVGSASAAPGESFTVDVSLKDIPTTGVSSMDFAIGYDNAAVSIESLEIGEMAKSSDGTNDIILSDRYYSCEIKPDEGSVNFFWTATIGDETTFIKDEGVIFRLSGKVLEGAAEGSEALIAIGAINRTLNPDTTELNKDITIGYIDAEFNSYSYEPIVTDGYVTVISPIKGDVNKNGFTDKTDAAIVLRHIAFGEKIADIYDSAAADTDSNSKVNISDVIYILNNITHKTVSLDLSTAALGGTYNGETGSLGITDTLQVRFDLPKTVLPGETVKVYIKAKDEGGSGFRAYLSDGGNNSVSDIWASTGSNIGSESTEIEFTLTAHQASDYVLFKGPDYQTNMSNITFEYIKIGF